MGWRCKLGCPQRSSRRWKGDCKRGRLSRLPFPRPIVCERKTCAAGWRIFRAHSSRSRRRMLEPLIAGCNRPRSGERESPGDCRPPAVRPRQPHCFGCVCTRPGSCDRQVLRCFPGAFAPPQPARCGRKNRLPPLPPHVAPARADPAPRARRRLFIEWGEHFSELFESPFDSCPPAGSPY